MMKPNDKAMQFKSEDYAGLVKDLRAFDEERLNAQPHSCEQTAKQAADAIEALLAERDALEAELDCALEQLALRSESGMAKDMQEIMRVTNELVAERDALAARLAPVDDEALRKMVDEIIYVRSVMIGTSTDEIAREVIDAVRPHIEAAERERCADVAEFFSSNRDWVLNSLWGNIRNEIAAAIRSGK